MPSRQPVRVARSLPLCLFAVTVLLFVAAQVLQLAQLPPITEQLLTLGEVHRREAAAPALLTLSVESSALLAQTSDRFLGFTIDLTDDREFFSVDFADENLVFLARELVAAALPLKNYIRVGGTGQDFLTYLSNGTHGCVEHGAGAPIPPRTNPSARVKAYYTGGERCLTDERLGALAAFLRELGAPVIFGLNINKRDAEGLWDPSNARELLLRMQQLGLSCEGFQLGNEVNSELTPEEHVRDLRILRRLLEEVFPPKSRPFLIGPDAHSLHRGRRASKYEAGIIRHLAQFAALIHPHDGIAGVSHHEYIQAVVDGAMARSDVRGFESGTDNKDEPNVLKGAWLDRSATIAADVAEAVAAQQPCASVWVSELGPHNAGRPRCVEGGRWANFGSSLWYMDALAAKAQMGVSSVFRQSLLGADYSLLDCLTHKPLPDYYATLLWQRLMGPKVLATSLHAAPGHAAQRNGLLRRSGSGARGAKADKYEKEEGAAAPTEGVRAYAHCSKGKSSVTLLILNLGDAPARVRARGVAVEQAETVTKAIKSAFRYVKWEGRYGGQDKNHRNVTSLLKMQQRVLQDFRAGDVNRTRYPSLAPRPVAARARTGANGTAEAPRAAGPADDDGDDDAPGSAAGAGDVLLDPHEGKRPWKRLRLGERGGDKAVSLGNVRIEYIMTAGKEGFLGSEGVRLNGQLLRVEVEEGGDDGWLHKFFRSKAARITALPEMRGRVVNAADGGGDIVMPPRSYGFFVYPEADVGICKEHVAYTYRHAPTRCLAHTLDKHSRAPAPPVAHTRKRRSHDRHGRVGPLKFVMDAP